MRSFDGENEVSRRKAEARAAGDRYMQQDEFNRPRRRSFLGALLTALGKLVPGRGSGQSLLGSRRADEPFQP